MNNLIVLIPHYNSPEALLRTIVSVSELFPIDILIVDDGSSEKPVLEDLNSAYQNKGKITLEFLPQNQGIEKALNHGLKIIKKLDYSYIGRLDSGDLSIAGKFKKQLDYLEKNRDVYLLGTWGNITDENHNHLYFLKHPAAYKDIKRKMYLNSCFIHPSVVLRSEVLDTVGLYPENRKSAEDFAYFFKVMKKHKVENLPEVLIDIIIDENGISVKKRKEQVRNKIRIIQDNFYIGMYPFLGLIRNTLLLYTSRSFIVKVRQVFKR